MSSIRFLYKSQYKPANTVAKNSNKPVTSGAVYDALQNIHANALFETGYFSEGIVGYQAQHILSFNKGTLKLAKGSILYYPSGKDADGNFAFTAHELSKDITTTNGVSGNYNTEFFVDITNEKLVGNVVRTTATNNLDVIQKVYAQDTDPYASYKDASYDGHIWWDTKENQMKVFTGGTNNWKTVRYSLPVGIVSCDGVNITGIVNDFLTCGYVDSYAFVNPGVIMLAPCGRSNINQSSYYVEMFDTDEVLVKQMYNPASVNNFEDYKLYVTPARELVGVSSYAMDRVKGSYTDLAGNEVHCCPVATLSAEKLLNGTAPAGVTSFTSRLPITIADKDDIDNVVKLVGSSHGLTIDELEINIEELKNMLTNKINTDVKALDTKLTTGYVRNSGNETINGVKIFSSAIKGTLDGKANRVAVTSMNTATDPEIIPAGIKVNAANDVDKTTLYTQTTVRIGHNKVSAEVFEGRATSMRWADLAEIYEADYDYEPGTLVMFGGDKEITLANGKANAVVSDKPAVLMNSGATGLPIAMVGRVKVRVLGPCKKFDNIVLHENATGVGMVQKEGGVVIGKALEDKELVGEGLVLCVVQLNLQ